MDLAKVWEEILFLIENKMTRQGYDTWFAQSRLVSFDGSRMVIQVPSKFHRDWIREHHGEVLSDVIKEVTKKDTIEIDFFVEPQEPQKKPAKTAKEEKKEDRQEKTNLLHDKKYTFNSFVVGPSNQFAHASAKAVS